MQQGLQARRPASLQAYGPVLIINLFSPSKSLFSHPPPPRPSSCQHLITTEEKSGCMSAVQDRDVWRGWILNLTQFIHPHTVLLSFSLYLCPPWFLFSLPHFLSPCPSLSVNVGQQLSSRLFWSLLEPHQQQLPKDGTSRKAKTRVPSVNLNIHWSLSVKVVLLFMHLFMFLWVQWELLPQKKALPWEIQRHDSHCRPSHIQYIQQ